MEEENCKQTIEGEEEGEDEDMAAKVVEDKLSIQQILEGMTNEFNRSVNTNKNDDEKTAETKIGKGPDCESIEKENKIIENQLDNIINITENHIEEVNDLVNIAHEVPVVDNTSTNEPTIEPEIMSNQQEPAKKDGSIQRIVLTFRTIDETTNDGRKTKISSCDSNLSLDPDELSNCDQIGGVSVKIEHSDDQSDVVEKSDNEEVKSDESKNDRDTVPGTEPTTETISPTETAGESPLNEDNSTNKDNQSDTTKTIESNQNPEAPSRRKRKSRIRERAMSDSTEETLPGPKRSARRLCKESIKSTVLESAMARKEKSNSTEENKKRKYTKPGRPKKLVAVKEKHGSQLAKPFFNDFSNYQDANSYLDDSKTSSVDDLEKDPLDDTQNSLTDFDGMPKLSPIMKNPESQLKPNDIGDDSTASDADKPFLKPVAGRSKRDRGRPRAVAARKSAKTDHCEGI